MADAFIDESVGLRVPMLAAHYEVPGKLKGDHGRWALTPARRLRLFKENGGGDRLDYPHADLVPA